MGHAGRRVHARHRQQVPGAGRRRRARQDRHSGSHHPVHPEAPARPVRTQGAGGGSMILDFAIRPRSASRRNSLSRLRGRVGVGALTATGTSNGWSVLPPPAALLQSASTSPASGRGKRASVLMPLFVLRLRSASQRNSLSRLRGRVGVGVSQRASAHGVGNSPTRHALMSAIAGASLWRSYLRSVAVGGLCSPASGRGKSQ